MLGFRPATQELTIVDLVGWESYRCAPGQIRLRGWDGDDVAEVVFSVTSSLTEDGDSDGDGLQDSWEVCGLDTDGDGVVDVDLPGMGADPLHADQFVEIDWMVSAGDHSHEPWLPSMINAWHEFNRAEVTNPDGTNGIALHLDVGTLYSSYSVDFDNNGVSEISVGSDGGIDMNGDGIPDIGNLGALGSGTPGGGNLLAEITPLSAFGPGTGFATIKAGNFNPLRDQVFRYAVFAHQIPSMRSGIAECGSLPPCDDFIVSLGTWPRQTYDLGLDGVPDPGAANLLGPSGLPVDGLIAQHTGTFLHELGHTLSLDHGGGDGFNFKPNYLSVMNYIFQFGLSYSYDGDLMADPLVNDFNDDTVPDASEYRYSTSARPQLNETSLNELLGIQDGFVLTTYSCPTPPGGNRIALGNGPIDWNCNGTIEIIGVSVDITNNGSLTLLPGFDDYNRIQNGGMAFQTGLTKEAYEQFVRDTTRVIPLTDENFMADRCVALERITFEEYPKGTYIDNQYDPLALFLNDVSRKPTVRGDVDRNGLPTHSPDQSLANLRVSDPVPLVIDFPTPQRMVGLYLGRVTPGVPSEDIAVLTAFDLNGDPMGQVSRVPPEGITGFLGVGAIFPDQPIARIELSYEVGASGEPEHIDDLLLCQTGKATQPPVFPAIPAFGDLPVTIYVEAKIVSEGSDPEGEAGHFGLVHTPLTGVAITTTNAITELVNGTNFSLSENEGVILSLEAPSSIDTAGGKLDFLHWEMDGHVFFPEDMNVISTNVLRDLTFKAVFTPLKTCNLVVDTTFDDVDTKPGDGLCESGQGLCTLRAAIQESNAVPGACMITLPAGIYTTTIPGAGEDAASTGDLDITDDVTILGEGADVTIVDGNALDTVFDILPKTNVDIFGITIRNGKGKAYPGGLDNDGVVNLGSCIITANQSTSANAGGVWNSGTMTIRNCSISDNIADYNGGGLYNSSGSLTLVNSTVSGNQALTLDGGGIANNGGEVTITNSTLNDNETNDQGGGIWNDSALTVTNSTISGNTASNTGGGIYNSGKPVNLNNVTIANNVAVGGNGGGVYNASDTFNFRNTIIAGNSDEGGSAPDCSGKLTSQGYNLLQTASGCTISGVTTGNIIGEDPLLSPLADNGGPSHTHALISISPAIDAGSPATPGSGGAACEATDQRDVARPQGAACDIGAYEDRVVLFTRVWSKIYLPIISR